MEIQKDDIVFLELKSYFRENFESDLTDLDISMVGTEVVLRASMIPNPVESWK